MLEYLAEVAVTLHEGTDGLDALHRFVNRAFYHLGEQMAHVLHPLEGGYKFRCHNLSFLLIIALMRLLRPIGHTCFRFDDHT